VGRTDLDDCIGAVDFPERKRNKDTEPAQYDRTQDSSARPLVWIAAKPNADEKDGEASSEK
jgi:hypothetical protein